MTFEAAHIVMLNVVANIAVKVTRQSTGRREVARSLCMLIINPAAE
jgi:hypothetical protein